MENPEIIFEGKRYKFNKSTGYYIFYDKDYAKRNGKMLHRAIWEHYSGKKIPKGYIIHHIDGNRGNNDYSNLMCVSPSEHAKLHNWAETARARLTKEKVDNFIEKARAWHKTPEGRLHSSVVHKGRIYNPTVCKGCGQTFGTTSGHEYCKKCIQKFRGRAKRRGLQPKDWERCICCEPISRK